MGLITMAYSFQLQNVYNKWIILIPKLNIVYLALVKVDVEK